MLPSHAGFSKSTSDPMGFASENSHSVDSCFFFFFLVYALTAAAQYKLHVKFKRAETQRLVETALTHHCTASYDALAKHYLKGNTDRPKRKLIKLQSSAV